jgi:hypothetical protein
VGDSAVRGALASSQGDAVLQTLASLCVRPLPPMPSRPDGLWLAPDQLHAQACWLGASLRRHRPSPLRVSIELMPSQPEQFQKKKPETGAGDEDILRRLSSSGSMPPQPNQKTWGEGETEESEEEQVKVDARLRMVVVDGVWAQFDASVLELHPESTEVAPAPAVSSGGSAEAAGSSSRYAEASGSLLRSTTEDGGEEKMQDGEAAERAATVGGAPSKPATVHGLPLVLCDAMARPLDGAPRSARSSTRPRARQC